KDFISRICKAVRNFILKMTQWWNEVSGNYETRLQKYDKFFDDSAVFKEKSDLEGFKGDWIDPNDIDTLETDKLEGKEDIGDKGEAIKLVQTAEKVIDAVLRYGSSTGSTYGDTTSKSTYNDREYDETSTDPRKFKDSKVDNVEGNTHLKELADELSEKAQENREKILDKLSDWKDKFDDKMDSLTDKMKDQDADTILQNAGASNKYGKPAKQYGQDLVGKAKSVIAKIRKDQDRDKQFNQAMSMAFERLDRKAMLDKGSPMDLDTRDAITRSVTTAQQILTKTNLVKTYSPKLLNLYFKDLATLKSMCKLK
ncbi:MAG: hypothetical protein VZR24_23165, partial [Butyrivibrio hungatei]|nr:hypothetical protein [Butyrivibrio hungatei]